MELHYNFRMLEAINRLQVVLSQAGHYLLFPSKAFYKAKMDTIYFSLDDDRKTHSSLPKQSVLQLDHMEDTAKVVVFNSHARRRGEVVTVKIATPNVRVYRVNNIEGV